MNPATAFAVTLTDELIRCGLAEAVLAPGSRSAPLALALWQRAQAGDIRLHVRIDERSAGFLALGLAKASARPVAVVCTSGTAAAHFHAAVIEADEAGVPLLVLTADRPPELRGTGANQAIDQLKLYGGAVRWFCETGVPEARPGMNAYWRSLACRAWAVAAGGAGGLPGPVHLNVALREPLVPGITDAATGDGWPEPLTGRPGGQPWTALPAGSFPAPVPVPAPAMTAGTRKAAAAAPAADPAGVLELPWAERGVIVCGDGRYDPAPLLSLAAQANWPVLAEPSSGARQGPHALSAYQYLLACPRFLAAHEPEIIVVAGRPGLSRAQSAFLSRGARRHVALWQGPGRWADPARAATGMAAAVRLTGVPRVAPSGWLSAWQAADAAARQAADAVLDAAPGLTEPGLARDLAVALPDGAMLWVASSLPARDLDQHMAPRAALRVLASRGASGVDGLVSSAIGAALAHQAAGGGQAAALLGDLALLHDAPGLFLGPDEPRPDLVLVIANNDGGGIFSSLEQAALPGPFERVFGTPHGARLASLASAAGIPHYLVSDPGGLRGALPGRGLRMVEVPGSRAAGDELRRAVLARAVEAAESVLG